MTSDDDLCYFSGFRFRDVIGHVIIRFPIGRFLFAYSDIFSRPY